MSRVPDSDETIDKIDKSEVKSPAKKADTYQTLLSY